MKRLLKWLETKFSRHSAAVEEEYSVSGDTTVVQPKPSVRYKSSLDASESTGGLIPIIRVFSAGRKRGNHVRPSKRTSYLQ